MCYPRYAQWLLKGEYLDCFPNFNSMQVTFFNYPLFPLYYIVLTHSYLNCKQGNYFVGQLKFLCIYRLLGLNMEKQRRSQSIKLLVTWCIVGWHLGLTAGQQSCRGNVKELQASWLGTYQILEVQFLLNYFIFL